MVNTKVNSITLDQLFERLTMKIFLRFVIFLTLLSSATAQDTVLTPPIGDRSKERRVEATSTCGLSGSETYCRFLSISSPPSDSLAPNCVTDICDNTCPHGDTSPTPIYLEDGIIPSSVTSDTSAPGQTGNSLRFSGQSNSFITRSGLPVVNDNVGFSFATWLRIDNSNANNGVLVSRNSTDSEEIFSLRKSSTSLLLSYLPLTGSTPSEITIPSTTLLPNQWYHIVVTIYQQDAAVYINGIIRYAVSLIANVKGPAGVLYLGRAANGMNSFSGNLDVPTYFSQSLTEREAFEAYSGTLSFLHHAPNCRCPPSNPVVSATDPSICIQHPGLSTNRSSVDRLNTNAQPPSYSNDNLTNSYWLSNPTERMVNITFTLSDKLIEILFLLAVFTSPRPQSLVILKSADNGLTYTPLQYYSNDCMGDFGLVAGADITSPSEAVCVNSFSFQEPVSTGLLNVDFFSEGRPGSTSFNTNLEFRNYISVNQIRFSFRNFFNSSTTDQHLYYSLSALTAVARCRCNGHASSCIYTSTTSTCQCQHNTQGDYCEECTSLHNDKPWIYGIPCVACNCNNHANSCVYNGSLDSNPTDRAASGGGVCSSCEDNTKGRFCDQCIDRSYRDPNKEISDPDVCRSCNCTVVGVIDQGLCTLNSNNIPQCNCKSNVEGSKCSICMTGFFSLNVSNPDGCITCECNTVGTQSGSTACDANTGQCTCKTNVQGLKCNACKSGFTLLTSNNPDGCVACACNDIGSVDNNCDPITSNCQCKQGVQGARCNVCSPGFHTLSTSGCQACQCDSSGSTSTSNCDVNSGNCTCKTNTEGSACDTCKDGFYDLQSSNSDGCIPCGCDLAGTSSSLNSCDSTTGNCNCKTNVEGRQCNQCKSGFFSILNTNPDGCQSCQCNSLGTNLTGDICDVNTGQCECILPALGTRCDTCAADYFISNSSSTLCDACACNSVTSLNQTCDSITGQCECRIARQDTSLFGFGGRTCEACIEGFIDFTTSGCTACNCVGAGSIGVGCVENTGQCVCKQNVEGIKCDTCKVGFGFLNANDPFGCSAVPTNLGTPTLSVLNSTSILITWQPPNSQSAILFYQVIRNSTQILQTTNLQHIDTGLSPYTIYTYFIRATNNAGTTESNSTIIRTSEDIPIGVSNPVYSNVESRMLQASWSVPTQPNGVITLYELSITVVNGAVMDVNVFSGLALSTQVTDLQPFTQYTFILRVCTSVGCTISPASSTTTTSTSPEQLSPPVASSITSTSLQLNWIAPSQPNGVITGYQVFQRDTPFTGPGNSIADLSASNLSLTVTGLFVFTQYEFSVSAATSVGSTTSNFTRVTTSEAVPTGIIAPTISVLSSRSIQITWQAPTNPNAASLCYILIRTSPSPSVSVLSSLITGSFIVFNLQPFTVYSFLLQVCSTIGCGNSSVVTMTTNEESPSGQQLPRVTSTNTDDISLQWDPPTQPNGIITSYTLSRRLPAITLSSQPNHEKGIRFHGAGYARFTAGTFVPGFSTNIQFLMRTFSDSGILLLFSTSSMSDYIVMSYNSTSVQFAFDSGPNSPTNILTLNVAINNGFWHSISATRVQNEGSLSVNGSFTVQNTVTGLDNEIAASVLVFVGGLESDILLPNGFPVLSRSSFAGCIRELRFNSEMVDFDSVQSSKQLSLSLDGCPVSIEEGTHYSGAGFAEFDASVINLNGDTFEITFDLRTLESSNIILAIGQNSSVTTTDYLAITISDSVPSLFTQIGGSSNSITFVESVVSLCDGLWHEVSLRKTQTSIILSVDQDSRTLNGISSMEIDLLSLGGVNVLSPIYSKLQSSSIELNNFGGCLRNLEVNNNKLDYTLATGIQNVDIDGCPSMGGVCTATQISDLNSQNVLSYTDSALQPFREYYYRVRSHNSVGSTIGNWRRASTQQGVPSPPSNLQLSALTSTSIQAIWTPPSNTNGVINAYYITVALADIITFNTTVPDIPTILITTGLTPFTSYTVSISTIFTSGTTSSSVSDTITTLQDAPSGVSTPTISSIGARNASFAWQIPSQPNGIITNYSLVILTPTQSTVYSGDSSTLNAIVLNLAPYTDYGIILRVCTNAGCTVSSVVQFRTDEDIPEGFDAPNLIVLDSRRIFVQWTQPSLPNGVITSYTVLYALASDPSSIINAGNTNSSTLEFTVAGLLPAMQYQFSVRATNRIGSITSAATINSTLTDVPEGISPPSVSGLTAFGFSITWQSPSLPNGEVTEYRVLLGQILVFTELQLQTTLQNLQPFTQYTLRVQACTAIGCGTSDSTQTRTLEYIPQGISSPALISRTSTSITIQISPVTNPNGLVTYTLYTVGVFNDSIGGNVETRISFTGVNTDVVEIEFLLPFNFYHIFLDANNTAGGIRSQSITVQTLGTDPTGFSAPTQVNATATTLTISWNTPSLPNGNIATYSLYGEANGIITGPVMVEVGADLNAVLTDLRPATAYSVYVVVFNQFGNGTSDIALIRTLESVPEDQPAPTASQIQSRSINLTWSVPSTPNGILIQYNIIQNGLFIMTINNDVLSSEVSSLIPFTQYRFAIEACTAIGCFRSDETFVTTMEDVPENILPPTLSNQSPTSVLIQWTPPLSPNGVIQTYTLERFLPSNNTITEIVKRTANESLFYVDSNEVVLRPFLTVLYRVTARNRIGSVVSMFANITTLQAPPEFILPPTTILTQPTSVQISWFPPTIPNGLITEYILKYNPTLQPNLTQIVSRSPSITTYTQHNLSPYLNYSFTITACTVGGCTESSVVFIETDQTLPTGFSVINVAVLSAMEIYISWVEPMMPNGVITEYRLNRREEEGSFVEIFTGLALSYNDTNLLPFRLYQYQLYITNGAGSTQYGNTSQSRTLSSPPLSGANLTVSTTNSSIILLQWIAPGIDLLRGEVVNYEVVGYLLGSGALVRSFYNGTDMMFSVMNLNPSTTYVFKVILSNGAGTAESNPVQATTLDGAPRDVSPPILSSISFTSVRAEWIEPGQPNGVIVSYNLLRDGQSEFSSNMTGEFVVTGLSPFTVYSFQLVACTRFACTVSNLTSIRTLQAPPTGLNAPNVTEIRHNYFVAVWASPSFTYGDITSYSLYLRSTIPCSQSAEQDTCDYVECPLGQSQCGTQCYSQSTHVCCQRILYVQSDSFACCGNSYAARSASSDVCCAGQFHTFQSQFSCCGGVYQAIPQGGICCEDGDSSSVGVGDSCCGITPFTDTAAIMCCGNSVVSQHINTMCCGGVVESTVDRICCSDVSYAAIDGFMCCHTSYVAENSTLCCTARNGIQKVTTYNSPSDKLTADVKCCGSAPTSSQLSCCNNRGYDPLLETCADRSTSTVSNCGTGVTCPNSLSNTAYCNKCDFAFSTHTCGTFDKTLSNTQICYQTATIFTGLALEYNVTGLTPYTSYLVYVGASNAVGEGISPEVSIRTLESTPLGVPQPSLTPLSSESILIEWNIPTQPNGLITHYFVYINSVQTAMANSTSYTDGQLSPFTTYIYAISACTSIGCTQGEASNATTLESPPINLSPPISTQITSTSLVLTWFPPSSPNGIIQNYTLQDDNGNVIFSGNTLTMTVTGLSPFTQYTFILQSCNSVGCTVSPSALFTTSEIVPAGIGPPTLQIIRFDVIEIRWSPPTSPNGIIQYYLLRKDDAIILNSTNLTYTDIDIFASSTYRYTIEAFNNVGSILSGAASITTPDSTPSGLDPPTVTAVNATAVLIEWIAPTLPNGIIIMYELYQNNVIFVTITDATQRSYIHNGLAPFTQYNFRVSACTRSGCAISTATQQTTLEAPPTNIAAPFLLALTSSSLRISWNPPETPNGIITGYELLQTMPLQPPVLIPIQPHVTTIEISNLNPFTEYTYTVKARNSAGSVTSTPTTVRTLEDFPMLFNAPLISNVTARTLLITWTVPTQANGIIVLYSIYARLITTPLNPIPMNREPVLLLTLDGNVTSSVVQNLEPGSSYEFRIAANNSVGQVITAWVPVSTEEDRPESLQPIQFNADPSGTSLELFWNEPLKPNGEINLYNIILISTGSLIFRGVSNSFTYRQLTPFTQYNMYLQACTTAGCSNGNAQVITTAEVAPTNQDAPTLETLGPSSIRISWQSPLNPNGIITRYRIERGSPDGSISLVHTVLNTTQRSFIDTGLLPYSLYNYSIIAENSVGEIRSEFSTKRTDEGIPTGLDSPTALPQQATEILIQWTMPSSPNGIITNYDIIRNGSSVNSLANTFEFRDRNLDPFTYYSYQVKACNARGGCTTSLPSVAQTLESIPDGIITPNLNAISFSQVEITWSMPTSPNGIIQRYMLRVNGVNGTTIITPFAYTLGNLLPATGYAISILACTSIGCNYGPSSNVLTLEYIPSGQPAPRVSAIGPNSATVSWDPPSMGNGVIIRYDVIRNGTLRQSTNDTQNRIYTDSGLSPAMRYEYMIRAYTMIGASDPSPGTLITTSPDAPEFVSPPTTTVLSSSSFTAVWSAPLVPNGVISRYELIVDGMVNFNGLQLEYTVEGLAPFTLYTVQIRACTTTCSDSSIESVRTDTDTPTGQSAPVLTAHAGPSVLIQWVPPSNPNGIITEYRIFRRELYNINGQVSFSNETLVKTVTGVLQTFDNSTELQFYTIYQFEVEAVNLIGVAVSAWTVVQTVEGIPQDVVPPVLGSNTFNSITIVILPPLTPNGVIRTYFVFRSGNQVAEIAGTENTTTLTNLSPYTIYQISIMACTVVGCNASDIAQLRTGEFTPSGVSPPIAQTISARNITFSWIQPTTPNGIIINYSIMSRTVCPQPMQPHISPGNCDIGPFVTVYTGDSQLSGTAQGLIPYTAYQFYLVALNSHSSEASGPSDTSETLSTDPENRNALNIRRLCNTVTVDWTESFSLNGLLKNFQVFVGDTLTATTGAFTSTISDLLYGASYEFRVRVVTSIGTSEQSTQITIVRASHCFDEPTVNFTTTTTQPLPSAVSISSDVAIIIIVIVVLLLLVLFIGFFIFCFVVLLSRREQEKYRTQVLTPLLGAANSKTLEPPSDLTLQESLMLENRSNTIDISLPRSKQSISTIGNSSITYPNSVRTPPNMDYSPRLTQLDSTPIKQTSDIDVYSQDESGFRDTKL